MADPLLRADASKDNLIVQIQDLQERMDELERFALTSQSVLANKIGVGTADLDNIEAGDIATIPWTDYSATSTIVGWTSYTTKKIFYKKSGKLVFVQYHISGTSDSITTTFTLPYTMQSDLNLYKTIKVVDNSTDAVGYARLDLGTSMVDLFPDIVGNNWTASNTKFVADQFWYETT